MTDLLQALPFPLGAGLLLFLGLRPITDRDVDGWLARFGVEVPGAREAAGPRLRRARRLRWSGAAAGLLVSGLPVYLNLVDVRGARATSGSVIASAWVFGIGIGALLAELAVQRPSHDEPRRAELRQRKPADYIDVRWRTAVDVTVAASVALAVAELLRRDPRWEQSLLAAAVAVGVAMALRSGLTAVAERPRIDVDADAATVDDALRAHGAHVLTGAAIACAGTLLFIAGEPLCNATFLAGNVLTRVLASIGVGAWWTLAADSRRQGAIPPTRPW